MESMEALIAVIIFLVSLAVVTFVYGKISERFFLSENSKNKKSENTEEKSHNKSKEVTVSEGFHMKDLRPSVNCCNLDSYGCVCVKCGRCGRIFFNSKKEGFPK